MRFLGAMKKSNFYTNAIKRYGCVCCIVNIVSVISDIERISQKNNYMPLQIL